MLQGATVHMRVVEHGLTCLDCTQRYPGDRLTTCPCCGGDGLVAASAPEAEVLVPGAAPGPAGQPQDGIA
jgi:Zn finger protein HypA/HybF involved in hydrogenase expression